MNINYQLKLRPTIPTIYGLHGYRISRFQLKEIYSILQKSGVEDEYILKQSKQIIRLEKQNEIIISINVLRTVIYVQKCR